MEKDKKKEPLQVSYIKVTYDKDGNVKEKTVKYTAKAQPKRKK